MLVARYIRYLENGTWKYASVKSVGELEKLLTTSKTDIVSAINELIANGGALEHDLNSRFDGLEGQQNELVTITGNVQETLGKVQDDLLNKAEAMYVDEQIKKLVNKADYDANYQKIEGELLDKVNIEKYNEEYKLVTAKLNDKTDLSAFEGVEGRVTTTEQEITNVKGELGSKIGKTEFDSAVGVNRWLARKYDINIGSAGAIPSFSHIKGKQPSEVIDYDDNSVIKPFTGDYYIGHYFTNIYMKVAKTVRLTVTNDDGAVIYMNGAKMYESTTRTTGLTIAMTFRAGWNTVEILHYEHSGAVEQVSLGLKLSEQVDKLTSVIGIGDKDDTRLVEAETQIKQNAEAILLKAEGSEVTSLGNKVIAHEASIILMKDEIKSLVKTDDFNKYTGRLESAESTIIQHSNQISQKVEKKDYDTLNNIVGEQQTSINQLTSEISLKATKSDFDGLNGRVGNAETQIKLNTESINLRAKQTELDKTNGRLSTAEAQLTVQAGEIASKVTQEDIDESLSPIESRVGNAESTIVQHTTAIGLKANANEVYKKAEADGKISTAVTQAKGEIKLETDKIALNVTNLTKTVTEQGTTISNHETSITQMKGAINLKAEASNVYTKTEADNKTSTAISTAKAEIEVTTKGITQTVTNVQNDLKGVKDTVTAQGTQIKQTSDEVAINVVKKGNVMASLNASTEGIKILGKHLDITSLVTFQSLDPTMQGKVNAGTDAKNLVDGMQFGFSNIVSKKQLTPVNVASSSYDKATNTWTLTANSGAGGSWGAGLRIVEKTSVVPIGSWFTVSFEMYSPIDTTWNVDVNNFPVIGTSTSNDNDDTALRKTSSKALKANTWTKCWFMWKNKDNYTSDLYDQSNIGLVNNSGAPVTFKMRNVKGELGNVVTDFSLAQQDVDDAIANVQVNLDNTSFGGRNIFLNAGLLQGSTNWYSNVAQTTVVIDGEDKAFKFTPNTGAGRAGIYQRLGGGASSTKSFDKDQDYTVSVMMKASTGSHKLHIGAESIDVKTVDVDTTWREYSHTFKGTGVGNGTTIFYTTALANGVDFYIKRMKLEKGNKKTDFTLAPEDYDKLIADVDQKAESSKNAIADMSSDNKATPIEKNQLKKEWATIVAEKPQYEALATTYGVTTEKTNYVNAYNALNTAVSPIIANTTVTSDINGATFRNTFDDYYDKLAQLIKKINELSRSIGTNADTKAQEAKNSIAEMANDNKITPLEKQQLKKEWASISAEKPQYEALANGYGIGTEKSNYVNAYNALNTFVTPFIANTTITSDINGATFRSTFDDYYDKKAQLIKKINELSKVVAQGLNGKVLYNDPMFKNGLNDVKVYNNSGNTNVTVTRVAKPSDAPTNSTHVLEIKALALPISPAYGGFSFQTASRANAIFVTRIVAKIPVGSKLVFASNSTGTGGKTEWLTPVTGTGNWEEYLCRVQCGSTGTFSSTNFFNIEGGTLPLTWHVAYATVIDATDYDYSITDMANDNKLTPLEKQQLKKEWATISAEKPQYEALSNTYGITTEKTNYVNAYNALNTFITPLIANIAITSDVTGATFRATFDDYYDKKAQLVKKVNELARTIGTNADAKAQEAKNSIADMSSDSKITPVEKVQLAKEWAVMVAEKPQYEALSTTYGITTEKTNFVNAYNTLNTVLNGTGGILTSMTTTSAVTGATFRAQFDDYYDKKAQLVKAINVKAKSLADSAQGTANGVNNTVKPWIFPNKTTINGGQIETGSVKAVQIDVANLFANTAFITNLKSQEIDASKIKTGQLVGIYIRSDGTNAFSYMSGGSIVSKSKVSTVETWIDEGLVRVKSSTSMLSLSEDNLSIGQIGKSGYGSLTYTAPNTDPSQNIFSMWGVGKIVIESNQSDIVLKGRAHIQGVDSAGVALNFPNANSIRFDGYGNITAPSTMINDATWSVRDGNGRTKLLVGVGKDSTTTSEYNAFGGGHAFNHNGERIFAIWKQGDANYVQQFAGQAIFKWQKNQGRFEIRTGDDTNWSKLAGIIENTSSREYKKNISAFDRSALDIINASKARLYHYNGQQDTERLNIGLIAEEAPELIQGSDGKTVDGYGMTTLAWKAIQELSEQVMHLNEKINNR